VSRFFVKDHGMRRENETEGMRSRAKALNRSDSGQALLDDSPSCLACFWPGSRSFFKENKNKIPYRSITG